MSGKDNHLKWLFLIGNCQMTTKGCKLQAMGLNPTRTNTSEVNLRMLFLALMSFACQQVKVKDCSPKAQRMKPQYNTLTQSKQWHEISENNSMS